MNRIQQQFYKNKSGHEFFRLVTGLKHSNECLFHTSITNPYIIAY